MSNLEIIFVKGLPASGKSTWSKEYIKDHPNYKIINKDSLRAMLDNSKWSKSNEKFIVKSRDALIIEALRSGYNVIVDDTNLHPSHLSRMEEIAQQLSNELNKRVILSITDFTNVSVEECIERDKGRPNYVGEDVIRKMYNQYLKPKIPTVPWQDNLPLAVISDLDGTLALFGDANPYQRDFTKDEVNRNVKDILAAFWSNDDIILVSGRKDSYRDQTEQWLKDNGIIYDHLYMRRADDNRKDVIIKREIYENEIKGKYNIRFILDDRDQVVNFWRSQGLTCLQVAEGDF